MKRILAVFLTLAMALNVAPVGAFAAADSNAASIVAIEETDESASSRLDEQTARAIASDPFLQQANAASQEQNSTIDTSDVSMEATNSFGKLLLNGMDVDKENGSSSSTGSNIQKITLNGRTATVDYTAAEDADLPQRGRRHRLRHRPQARPASKKPRRRRGDQPDAETGETVAGRQRQPSCNA